MALLGDKDVPLESWAESLERTLSSSFATHSSADNYSVSELPAAAFAAIQLRGDRLLVCNLGDCAVLVRLHNGQVVRLGTSCVDKFDALVLSILHSELSQGGNHASAKSKMREQILRNRALVNTTDGYWVASPKTGWAGAVEIFELDLKLVDRVMLATDGFLRIVDTYQIYTNEVPLLDLDQRGLDQTISLLRDVEIGDPCCQRIPRIKPADDATAVILKVGSV